MTASLAVAVGVGLLVPFAPSLGWLVVLRAVQGAALAGLPASATAYLAEEVRPKALVTAIGLFVAGNSVGGMSGRVITGWVAQEWARGATPYGGFPWARLAFSQADSPLAHAARWLGAPGVTFAVAVVGTLLLAAVTSAASRSWLTAASAAVAAVALVALTPLAISLPVDGRAVSVGFVQGNVPQAGLEFNAQRRAVLDNHVTGTERLAARAPDDLTLVVWPENSSDIDPFRNPDAAAQIDNARTAVAVPLLIGAVLAEPPGYSSNVSLFYLPGVAEPQRYVKLHPVPFAEYIPARAFFRIFTPMADLAGNFVAGDRIGLFTVPAAGGEYVALPTICFEVAYDGLMRDSVRAAGDDPSLLVVQTNNATFGYTDESVQQLAISRIRAMEHGRSVVHVSTVGVSALITPDGTVHQPSALFTRTVLSGSLPLRSVRTVATMVGPWPEYAAGLAFAVVLLVGLRRRPTEPATRIPADTPVEREPHRG